MRGVEPRSFLCPAQFPSNQPLQRLIILTSAKTTKFGKHLKCLSAENGIRTGINETN